MSDPALITPELALTTEGLGGPLRAVFDAIAERGFRHVQLDATERALRPRELGRSGRRDLAASLRRREIGVSGLDLWIPAAHFTDRARADRAVSAVLEAIGLAADLGRCPVSVGLPVGDGRAELIATLAGRAHRDGVDLADHAVPPVGDDGLGVGVDPAAWLGDGADPSVGVARASESLVSARLCDLATDGMRAPVGDPVTGRLDVTAYRVALSVVGYARPVVVDTRRWVDVWAGVEQSRAAWMAAGYG